MNGNWYLFSFILIAIAAWAAGTSTGKISTGIAVFCFGYALSIWADEICGGDKNRKETKR